MPPILILTANQKYTHLTDTQKAIHKYIERDKVEQIHSHRESLRNKTQAKRNTHTHTHIHTHTHTHTPTHTNSQLLMGGRQSSQGNNSRQHPNSTDPNTSR